jgi:predicted N-formylglutamate amidohydrolase
MKIIITCEHGGNKIPNTYLYLFANEKEILETHRAYDPGALELARQLSSKAADYFFYSDISRLLVELNRSLNNRNLFSKYVKNLYLDDKCKILDRYYFPYRNKVENVMRELISGKNKIIHISIHSFTSVLNNKIRNADIGILFDPARKKEKEFASAFKNKLLLLDKGLKVRFNYPYLGTSDGFTTYLRKKFNQKNYAGIEVEVNQKFILNDKGKWKELRQTLSDATAFVLRRKNERRVFD